jgi:hypothetical protein
LAEVVPGAVILLQAAAIPFLARSPQQVAVAAVGHFRQVKMVVQVAEEGLLIVPLEQQHQVKEMPVRQELQILAVEVVEKVRLRVWEQAVQVKHRVLVVHQ